MPSDGINGPRKGGDRRLDDDWWAMFDVRRGVGARQVDIWVREYARHGDSKHGPERQTRETGQGRVASELRPRRVPREESCVSASRQGRIPGNRRHPYETSERLIYLRPAVSHSSCLGMAIRSGSSGRTGASHRLGHRRG